MAQMAEGRAKGGIDALVVVNEIDPVAVFTGGGLDHVLAHIKKQVEGYEPDTKTAKGRKEIGSLAHKVARSKTLLDGLGKELVADWKAKAKKVDASRKHCRDFLDALKAEVRKPLTDWEDAEKKRIAAEKLKAEIDQAYDAAVQENELFERQREIERKEAEIAKAKADAERKEREDLLKKEAAERARREAEERAQQEIIRAKLEKELVEREAKEAARQAEREKQEAIERAKREAEEAVERKERERLAKEEAGRKEAERIAQDKAHQRQINAAALADFEINGLDTATAKKVIGLIALGMISYITINY